MIPSDAGKVSFAIAALAIASATLTASLAAADDQELDSVDFIDLARSALKDATRHVESLYDL